MTILFYLIFTSQNTNNYSNMRCFSTYKMKKYIRFKKYKEEHFVIAENKNQVKCRKKNAGRRRNTINQNSNTRTKTNKQ